MLEQVATETLQEKVYIAIKDSIMRNDLLPGQPLSTDELARDLGVSPTPVREALTRLSADGLVERTPNKTACVAKITGDDVHQNYEVRQLIEPYVTAVAARRISTVPDLRERLTELQQKARSIKETATSGPLTPSQRETCRGIGLELYKIALDALDHDLLKRVFSLISDHSLRIRSFAEASSLPYEETILPLVNDEHIAIIDALLAGDEKRVKWAVKRHLVNAQARTNEASRRSQQ